jgi:ankyrin repeat protein
MKLSDKEIREIQEKYHYYGNYEAEDPNAPIDPLTYVDSNGDALLHIAARRGDQRTIELLLGAGVDVNLIGDMGNTALHYAQTGDVARVLLDHGASTEVCNEFGKRPTVKV